MIGIFGGSFNPVHCGHIQLAQAIVDQSIVDEVWLTLSPLNPLKADSRELASDADRMAMLQLAVKDHKGLKACDIELTMPRPSYTIDTLRRLEQMYPDEKFRLIIGSDNLLIFNRWRASEELMRDFKPIVYPRPGYEAEGCIDVPQFDISSTEVRERIRRGEDVNNLVPAEVSDYIRTHHLYV